MRGKIFGRAVPFPSETPVDDGPRDARTPAPDCRFRDVSGMPDATELVRRKRYLDEALRDAGFSRSDAKFVTSLATAIILRGETFTWATPTRAPTD